MAGDAVSDFELLLAELGDAPFRFGLAAQGHLPTIERMLGEGASWEAIGRAIGWCPRTAQEHYERHRAASA